MAQATGSIQFDNALPDQYTRLTINDGQGTGYSEVTLHFGGNGGSNFQHNPFKTSNDHQNQYSGQGALKVIPLYLTGTGNTRPYMRLRFDRNSQNAAFWQSISTGGTHPARLVFRDYAGNEVKITFVNEDLTSWSDGDALASPNAETRGRRQSAGEYHLSTWTNQYYPLLSSNFTETILKILRAARELGEINLGSDDHLKIQSSYLKIASDTAGGPDNGPISVMIERASGTWTQLDKDLFWATLTDDGGFTELQGDIFAHVDEPNAPVYSFYSFTNDTDLTPGGSGAGAAMASYVATIINNLGIQITAAASSNTVSLTNDNEGTDGNISMTAIKYASSNVSSAAGGLTIAGLAGGAEGGGGSLVVSGSITAASGGTVTASGAEVTIPSGSLSSDTTIGIDLSSNESNLALNGLRNAIGDPAAQSYSPVVELTPHGTQFSSAVTVTFDLSGSVAGSCPADLAVYKKNDASGVWYQLPSSLWSCSDGTITISTTSFSQYQAIGGTNMARTKLNNVQIAKLIEANKVLGGAIDITGSVDTAASLSDGDSFLIQGSSGISQKIAASAMQDYFSSVDVTETSGSGAHRIVFIDAGSGDAAGASLEVDNDSLTFDPSTNILTVATASVVGLSASSDIQAGGAITIGGAADLNSTLDVQGNATFQGSASVQGDIDLDGTLDVTGAVYAKSTLQVDGAADLNSTLDVQGNVTFQASASVQGDIDLDGTLDVTGAAHLKSTLRTDGVVDFRSSMDVDGAATFQSTVSASSNITGGGTLTIAGNSDLNGQLDVQGAANFSDTVTIAGNLTVQGATTTVDSTNTLLQDPLMVLGSSSNGAAADGDRGIVLELSSSNNKAMFWDQSASEFAFVDTTSGHDATTIATTDYANLHIGGLVADDAVDINGAIDVQGNATIQGSASVQGDLDVDAALNVTGAAHLKSTLRADGVVDFRSSMDVDGAATFQSTISGSGDITGGGALTIAGAIDANSSADFQGAVNLQSTLDVAGNAAFAASASVAGDMDIDGVLNVTGASHLKSTLRADGVVDFRSSMDVDGAATFQSSVSASSDITGGGALTIAGASDLNGTLSVAGQADFDGALNVTGAALLKSSLEVDGALQLDGIATGSAALSDEFYFQGASNSVRKESLADMLDLAKSDGIQISSGLISIDFVEDIATSASQGSILSSDLVTASLSQEPLADSVQVYLNGMLQVASGSAGDIFDYEYLGSAGSRRVEFVVALDSDDVVQLRYIKK